MSQTSGLATSPFAWNLSYFWIVVNRSESEKNRNVICLYIMSYGMPLAEWGKRFRYRKQAEIDIQPVQRIRAHEEVVRQLRALMEREVLRTGDRLPSERELAKQFGVSRVTVRQALSVLQAMGLIESRIGNGTFARAGHKALSVTDLAPALRVAQGNLTEQLELRRLIEPQVACLAAERATAADLDDLLRYISLQEARLAQGVPFVEEDGAFHLAIAQATKNSLLVKMVEGIQELLQESHEHSMRASGGRDSRRWLMLRSRSQPDEPSGPWQPVWPICRSWLCRRRVRAA